MAISIVVLLLWSLLNLFRVDKVGWVNSLAAIVQFSSVFIIMGFILIGSYMRNGADGLNDVSTVVGQVIARML